MPASRPSRSFQILEEVLAEAKPEERALPHPPGPAGLPRVLLWWQVELLGRTYRRWGSQLAPGLNLTAPSFGCNGH